MSSLHQTKGWDHFSKTYASRTQRTNMAAYLSKFLTNTNDLLPFSSATSILDNGCGPGIVTERLIQNYATDIPLSSDLLCADFSAGMVEQAKVRRDECLQSEGISTEEKACWERVKTSVQDAMALDLPEESQSHILASMVYFLTPDPFACLTSSYRVLKPDGVLATSGLEQAQWVEAMEAGRLAVKPDSDLGKVSIPASWRDRALLKGEWEKAGFRDVTVESVGMEMGFESYRGQIDMLGNMPHVKALLEELSVEEKERWAKVVEDKMREYAPVEPGMLKGSVLVAVGRK